LLNVTGVDACICLDVPEETETDLLVGAAKFPFSVFVSHVNNYAYTILVWPDYTWGGSEVIDREP